MGEKTNAYKVLMWKDVGIDVISTDLREKSKMVWIGLFWLTIGTIGCCLEHDNVATNS